jgi:thiol:disulfide interchange protein
MLNNKMFLQNEFTCSLKQMNMLKKIVFPGLLILAAVIFYAFIPKANESNGGTGINKINSEKGIQFFEPNLAKALQEAKKQNKLIFIDAYTTWCGPCRMLKQNTFTDKAVGDFFNKNFINIALDMENGDGLAFAAKYQIVAYPTLLIINADQTSTSVTEGYMEPAQLLDFGKSVLAQKRK